MVKVDESWWLEVRRFFRSEERERQWGRKRREVKNSVSREGRLENSIEREMEGLEEHSVNGRFTDTSA